jgi:NTP pyrophosphatase (non-canonical NTP hydrolase)
MILDEYQERAYDLALPTTKNITYMLLGVTNESGEAAGKLKKALRGDKKLAAITEDIAQELGDVLWYVSGAARVLGYSLDEIACMNLKKLEDRQLRGKLQGDGDER